MLSLCRVGCATNDVLAAAGLNWRDLFAGVPTLLPSELAALESERARRESARQGLCESYRVGAARLRGLEDFIESLAPQFMSMPDGEEADRLTKLYHSALDEIRRLESVLDSIEGVL